MRKLFKFLTGRLFLTSLFILMQLCTILLLVITLSSHSIYVYFSLCMLSLLVVIFVASSDKNPSFRLAWVIPILVFPVFGWLLYYMFSYRKPFKKTLKKLHEISDNAKKLNTNAACQTDDVILSCTAQRELSYLNNYVGANARRCTQTSFFKIGDDFFPVYLEKLRSAEKFIFIEYFIIEEGKMWNAVLDILKEKAQHGVIVRVLYDDLGTINLLPANYVKKLASFGIEACVFNKYHASIDTFLNSRDHRKITVIDGKICFTGGLNLSDEYINQKLRFGHWKDCAIMLEGDAVDDMTQSFLTLWHFSAKTDIQNGESKFFTKSQAGSDGIVCCFEDEPFDDLTAGKSAYMNIINGAKNHVYICTPYLILDNEIAKAIKLCAQTGINVKIVTPHIPDKKYVHDVTRSNYDSLIHCGVEIYEYTKGFVHAKMIESDSEVAIVGTVNFDFRSFYHHFENGVFMYKSKAVKEVENDFEELFKTSAKISENEFKPKNIFSAIRISLLRLFSPLM